jgi:signal transduction histidine kinase
VQCTFRWDRVAQVPDDATATHLYRIAQEAVANAVRHGRAKRIEITLASRGGTLVLAVADNGVGIPHALIQGIRQGVVSGAPVAGRRGATGIGLQTMNFRARVIGGSFGVTARKGGGTVVTCTIRHEPAPFPAHRGRASGKLSRAK